MLKFLFNCIFRPVKIYSREDEKTIYYHYRSPDKRAEKETAASPYSTPEKDNDILEKWFSYVAQGALDDLKAIRPQIKNINACNKDGNSALHIAAKNLDTETIKFLLLEGCNKNLQNKDSKTARDLVVSDNTSFGDQYFHDHYFKAVEVLALLPYEGFLEYKDLMGNLESFDA